MKITRREFLSVACAVVLSIPLDVAGYSFLFEPSWIEVTHSKIPLPGLKSSLNNFRLVLVSDIHYGTYLSDKQLLRVVKIVNQLNADLIVHAGDFVSEIKSIPYIYGRITGNPNTDFRHSPNAERLFGNCIPAVEEMKARFGAVAVLGNHDHWVDAEVARKYLMRSNINLIENTSRVISFNNAGLTFVGVDDLWEGTQDLYTALKDAPPATDTPRIVLSHNPDFADDPQVSVNNIGLMLSGHTHGGQVTLPGFGAPILPIANKKYAKGLVTTDWGKVYISRGIGRITPPVRFCTRPEIAVLDLIA